jgi:tRNA pseudouridine55 synthase
MLSELPDQKLLKNSGTHQGILLLDKAIGRTSFSLVSLLRKRLNVKKIGHAGTLDPFASGVMVMMVGRDYTRRSAEFLCEDKEYEACVHLGVATDSFDCDGKVTKTSDLQPSLEEINEALTEFQGRVMQTPPMFSAKKINGKKLYELARKGETVERAPVEVSMETKLLSYSYPELHIHVRCSKGTYIRSIADDLGSKLSCGGHLTALRRTRSGTFHIDDCVSPADLEDPEFDLGSKIIQI